MADGHYTFDDVWHVQAPPSAVWPLVYSPSVYPRWWPQYRSVERLNALDGVGQRFRTRVRGALPYIVSVELELVTFEEPVFMEARLSGDLVGSVRWTLTPEGSGTRLHLHEEVGTARRLFSALAPLLRPAFAWNHRIVMQAGERGLQAAIRV